MTPAVHWAVTRMGRRAEWGDQSSELGAFTITLDAKRTVSTSNPSTVTEKAEGVFRGL